MLERFEFSLFFLTFAAITSSVRYVIEYAGLYIIMLLLADAGVAEKSFFMLEQQ